MSLANITDLWQRYLKSKEDADSGGADTEDDDWDLDDLEGDGEGDDDDGDDFDLGDDGDEKENEPGGGDDEEKEPSLGPTMGDVDNSDAGPPDPLGNLQKKLLGQTTSQRFDPNLVGNLHDFGAMEISKSAAMAGGHRPYTTEMDRVIPPRGEGTLAQYSAISDPMKPITHVVSGVLTRTLLTQTKARTLRQRSSGNISLSNMAQIKAKQPNIFQVKRNGTDLDTYVHLIVDHSGSMGGRKIDVAAQTCICLGDALDKVGIAFGISGFTAGWGLTDGFTAEQMALHDELMNKVYEEGANFERTDPITEYVYKTADESYNKIKPLLALMKKQSMGCNGDGDSIHQIAKRVAKRREKRKILIVLSDGLPAISQGSNIPDGEADRYLKKIVALIDQVPGMEVIGIGITTEAVRRYYKRALVVNNISDLPRIAVTELKDALLGKLKPVEAA